MKYQGRTEYIHGSSPKVGVLLTNLGTPDQPTASSLRTYLREFLSDPRVIEVPRLIWMLILHCIVLVVRPRKVAKVYQGVWTEEGSPLLVIANQQKEKVKQELMNRGYHNVVVEFGMRYGNPSMASQLQKMQEHNVDKLLVLPLYPQYSAATVGSTFDAVAQDFTKRRSLPDFRFVSHYHDHPKYIAALGESIKEHWESNGRAQLLVLSYHGLPLSYLHKGDPYHCECYKTTRLVKEYLELEDVQIMTTFQSRFGSEEWLQPYTDETMQSLPAQGVTKIQVACPGFSADCIETIEEIDEENREYFLEAGGESFHYIPALNSREDHIDLIASLIEENIAGWEGQGKSPPDMDVSKSEYQKRIEIQS